MTRPARPDASRWAGAVAAWCVLWLVVGVWTGVELLALRRREAPRTSGT